MASIPSKQLFEAAKLALSIATGGFVLVCQRPEDFPLFAMATYLSMTIGFLLLYLSLGSPQLRSTTAIQPLFFRFTMARIPADQLLKAAEFVLAIATGGFLLVCNRPKDFFAFAAALYLLMTIGFLLLYLSMGRL